MYKRQVKYPYNILDPAVNTCVGDANQDGVINVNDLLLAVSEWGQSGTPADINNDGTVNVADILIMIDTWGICP